MPPPNAADQSQLARLADRVHDAALAATDRIFGTRRVTVGARLQIPRKAPLRIEPKTYFGERGGGGEGGGRERRRPLASSE